MTYIDHLNDASDHLDQAREAAPSALQPEIQRLLDALNDLIATQEAIERRAATEDRSR